MASIRDRILQVQENISRVCERSGRRSDEITLVAVTKYVGVEEIREAIVAGITHIGENRVQDAERHFTGLGDDAKRVTRHMIGHLQTNKVKTVLGLFDMIQSLDSVKLTQEIEKRAIAQGQSSVDVLIEVNSGEEQKTGVSKTDLIALAEQVAGCEHIRLKGLMTMAPLSDDKDLIRQAFRDLRILKEKVAVQFKGHPRIEMRCLSMGMTDDYEVAIEEGATMLRIGRAIFRE